MRYRPVQRWRVLLAVILSFCCGSVSMATEQPELESWIDHAADGFAGGTGTEEDPYLIATAEQLAYLAKEVNEGDTRFNRGQFFEDAFFRLIADIDLTGREWEPIAKWDRKILRTFPVFERVFCGDLDGAGHRIRNMTIVKFSTYNALFGVIGYAKIRNLHLDDVHISSGYLCGGFAGFAILSSISNCTVSGDISALGRAGGVAGYGVNLAIEQISMKVDLTITNTTKDWEEASKEYHRSIHPVDPYSYVGGVVGEMSFGDISNCVVDARFMILDNDYGIFGEFVGLIDHETKIKTCVFSGFINKRKRTLNVSRYE